MPHRGTTFDPSCDAMFACPAPNCEQTKHNIKKFSVFRINWLSPPSPSESDTGCSWWRHNSVQHISVILKYRPKPPVLKYGNEGTNCYKVKAPCILYLSRWWGICVQLQAPRKQLTVITSNILVGVGWTAPLCLSHISHCYISNFIFCGHGYSSTAMLP